MDLLLAQQLQRARGRNSGLTSFPVDTIKFAILSYKNTNKVLGYDCGTSSWQVRTNPPAHTIGALDAMTWVSAGAPLKTVAKAVKTKQGIQWKPINGRVSWSKRIIKYWSY
ncbi:MAG: hypothetical protein GY928_33925 [Colwellia sp.]|nr:hypothetical protein [Colwellia sp.]